MCSVSGSGDGKIEYPICRELSAMVLRLGRATVLRGRLHRGCWSDEMTVMFVLPMLVMLLPFQDTVLVDLVGGLSWGSCAPHAQANTNFWDPWGLQGFRLRVSGLGPRVWGSGFRVSGLGV